MRFLALGDSYTIGESVETSQRWPVQLVTLLRAERIQIDDPIIIARTGWTTDELMRGIDQHKVQGSFDLVSLLIGVNNQYRGRDPKEYQREFIALLQRAIELAGGKPNRVLVLSIPDWGVTPFASGRNRAAIGAAIDQFNAINREESERAGVHYLDITPISRRAAADRSLIASDGLHPSGVMYAEWARLALPIARRALS